MNKDNHKHGTLNMMSLIGKFSKFTKIQVFMTMREILNLMKMHVSVVEIEQNAVE